MLREWDKGSIEACYKCYRVLYKPCTESVDNRINDLYPSAIDYAVYDCLSLFGMERSLAD